MTRTSTVTGHQRLVFVPAPAESVPRADVSRQPQDPPIYRELMRTWAERGRTLPGRHDPEWVRLAAPLVRPGQFSGFRFAPDGER
ncbi:hypothetical protein MTQ10_00860 [Streptomyces sp. XM83C]|jgi:hypothetical protein|uniref:hypothetical protein n=1 Tax=Streptomyces TaxID=1883 RepID=UPI001FF94A7E|nr:hypothetical protein [Streptomyces sp. XM83C]MCK1818185.1 hypothetical protein [Streptomyces sp. XM83C]